MNTFTDDKKVFCNKICLNLYFEFSIYFLFSNNLQLFFILHSLISLPIYYSQSFGKLNLTSVTEGIYAGSKLTHLWS